MSHSATHKMSPVSIGRCQTVNIGKETEFVEFKETTAETEKGIVSMSTMLNKHGKRDTFFGVKNNGDVVGQKHWRIHTE